MFSIQVQSVTKTLESGRLQAQNIWSKYHKIKFANKTINAVDILAKTQCCKPGVTSAQNYKKNQFNSTLRAETSFVRSMTRQKGNLPTAGSKQYVSP